MTTYTQEQIIQLAQQCWPSDRSMWAVDANLPGLLRFVELAAPSTSQPLTDEQIDGLIAAAPREDCEKKGWIARQRRVWIRAAEAAIIKGGA